MIFPIFMVWGVWKKNGQVIHMNVLLYNYDLHSVSLINQILIIQKRNKD